MVWLLGIVLIYLLFEVLLVGVGLTIGFVLHWLVPPIDIGMGTLIGIVSTALVIYFLWRITSPSDEQEISEAAGEPGEPGPQRDVYFYPMLPLSRYQRRRSRRR